MNGRRLQTGFFRRPPSNDQETEGSFLGRILKKLYNVRNITREYIGPSSEFDGVAERVLSAVKKDGQAVPV